MGMKSRTPKIAEYKSKETKVEPAIRASTSMKGVFGVLKKAIDIAGKQGGFSSSQISAMYTNLLKANKSVKSRSENYKNSAIENLIQNYCKKKERVSMSKIRVQSMVLSAKDMNKPSKAIQYLTSRASYEEKNRGKENCEVLIKSSRSEACLF
eukprot:TRINITY_DN15650_c0_g4_i1.p3 TRINITY_DN15650_c0_g4~~TRINITY_DN15650_c0_g4_i1.p3  ORF type:complete len:153 (-),score=42.85 TRINITY_DN15650_c0_g4_i1:129-587(-)